ncbi:unnamed protein product [Pedinophyceae sp. YPF-701]|nr:unnamed protein product [Pedinophyceae sp. YPF-701]
MALTGRIAPSINEDAAYEESFENPGPSQIAHDVTGKIDLRESDKFLRRVKRRGAAVRAARADTAKREAQEAHEAILEAKQKRWLLKRGHPEPPPELSEQQRREIEMCFKLLDDDGSGALDADELYDAFKELGFKPKKQDIARILMEIDSDGNGLLEFDEFLSIMGQQLAFTAGTMETSATANLLAGGDLDFPSAVQAYRRQRTLESFFAGGEGREQAVKSLEDVSQFAREQQDEDVQDPAASGRDNPAARLLGWKWKTFAQGAARRREMAESHPGWSAVVASVADGRRLRSMMGTEKKAMKSVMGRLDSAEWESPEVQAVLDSMRSSAREGAASSAANESHHSEPAAPLRDDSTARDSAAELPLMSSRDFTLTSIDAAIDVSREAFAMAVGTSGSAVGSPQRRARTATCPVNAHLSHTARTPLVWERAQSSNVLRGPASLWGRSHTPLRESLLRQRQTPPKTAPMRSSANEMRSKGRTPRSRSSRFSTRERSVVSGTESSIHQSCAERDSRREVPPATGRPDASPRVRSQKAADLRERLPKLRSQVTRDPVQRRPYTVAAVPAREQWDKISGDAAALFREPRKPISQQLNDRYRRAFEASHKDLINVCAGSAVEDPAQQRAAAGPSLRSTFPRVVSKRGTTFHR